MLLGGRSNYTIVPAIDWPRYVETPVASITEQGGIAPSGSESKAAE